MASNTVPNFLLYCKDQVESLFTQLPDLNFILVAQILFTASCTALSIWLLDQSASVISKIQRNIYQSNISYNIKNKFGSFLKKLKPNSSWVFAFILIEISKLYFENSIYFTILFYDPIYIYIIYKLIFLACSYSINTPYSTTNKFISKSILEKNYAQTQRYSGYSTLFFIPFVYNWDEFISFE